MTSNQITSFLDYLEQCKQEENEFAYSLFIERAFKYAELELIDSLTKKPIAKAPIFSGLCINKQTASVCLFDVETVFSILFKTEQEKNNFEDLLTSQQGKCPICGEEISFNYLIFDPFLMLFHKYASKLKGERVVLKMDLIRKTNNIKYSVLKPIVREKEFQGEINLHQKPASISIDQFQRVFGSLESEIQDLEKDKQNAEKNKQIEQEIKIRQQVQSMLIEQQQQQKDMSDILKRAEEPSFRVLRVGDSDQQFQLSVLNKRIFTFKNTQVFISNSSLAFQRVFQIFQLILKPIDSLPSNYFFSSFLITFAICVLEQLDIEADEDLKCRRCLLIYDSVMIIVTKHKIYQIQLLIPTGDALIIEEIFKFEIPFKLLPQVCFLNGDLFLLDFNQDEESIKLRIIEDVLLHAEETSLIQPQLFVEVSSISNREKVLLIADEFSGELIIVTQDQYFKLNTKRDIWKEFNIQQIFQEDEDDEEKEEDREDDDDYDDDQEENTDAFKFTQIKNLREVLEDLANVITINTSKGTFLSFVPGKSDISKLDLNEKSLSFLKAENGVDPFLISQNAVFENSKLTFMIKTPPYTDGSKEQLEKMVQLENDLNSFSTHPQAKKKLEGLTYCPELIVMQSYIPF